MKKDYQTAIPMKGQKQYSHFTERLTEPHCRLDAAAVNNHVGSLYFAQYDIVAE